MSEQNWSKDYAEFLSAQPETPPRQLTENIVTKVRAELEPPGTWVLAKLLILHSVSVSLTLLFCPQFGINPLKIQHGLMHFFMAFGDHVCMLACGATVIGLSLLFAALVMRPEELRSVKRWEYWVIPGLSFATLGIFSVYGEFLVAEMLALWALGAVVAGKAALEFASYVRVRAHF